VPAVRAGAGIVTSKVDLAIAQCVHAFEQHRGVRGSWRVAGVVERDHVAWAHPLRAWGEEPQQSWVRDQDPVAGLEGGQHAPTCHGEAS